MSREPIEAKSARYLLEGRVIVREIDEHAGAVYSCGRDEQGHWFCNCQARGRCAHLEAVKRVTALEPRRAIS